MHYIIREDYWRPSSGPLAKIFFRKKRTYTHTNRLGQKTPLIKVSYSKQRPKIKLLGNIFT